MNYKTILILGILGCINIANAAEPNLVDTCQTQYYLSTLDMKALVDGNEEELYRATASPHEELELGNGGIIVRTHEVFEKSYGGCKFQVANYLKSIGKRVVTVFSNGASLYHMDFRNEDNDSSKGSQTGAIRNAYIQLTNALAKCGCTKL